MTAVDKMRAFLEEAEKTGARAFGHYDLVKRGLMLLAEEIDAGAAPAQSTKPTPAAMPVGKIPNPPKG